ncbi:MAG TPA: cation diffusion facilitator family transporter [Roseiflexaceae bacterium]|nr:cation diffusion facilitator family transporter [Roseiflexaceae bacterium]
MSGTEPTLPDSASAHSHNDHDDHDHGDHAHDSHDDHDHSDHMHDGHEHAGGLLGFVGELFHVHGHSHEGPQVDKALTSSEQGIRAVKISLIGLFATAILQVVIVIFSGSVALLADTIHNFADGLTAIPLWIAFSLSRRPADRRYTYGWGRAEDIAGIFIVLMIAISGAVAAYEAVVRLLDPQPLRNIPWVIGAAIIGFIGNEIVAEYRIRIGRQIGSAALMADGQHARVDGLTSLAVLGGAIGAALGWQQADPIIGLLITVAIVFVLKDAAGKIWERLMDAVDPKLVDAVEQTAQSVDGIKNVHGVRVRWMGHKLLAELHIGVDGVISTVDSHAIAEDVRHQLLHKLPALSDVIVHADPWDSGEAKYHTVTAHHFS